MTWHLVFRVLIPAVYFPHHFTDILRGVYIEGCRPPSPTTSGRSYQHRAKLDVTTSAYRTGNDWASARSDITVTFVHFGWVGEGGLNTSRKISCQPSPLVTACGCGAASLSHSWPGGPSTWARSVGERYLYSTLYVFCSLGFLLPVLSFPTRHPRPQPRLGKRSPATAKKLSASSLAAELGTADPAAAGATAAPAGKKIPPPRTIPPFVYYFPQHMHYTPWGVHGRRCHC